MLKPLNLTKIKDNFLPVSYAIFLLGFFFFPTSKSHSNFFYIAVALPFLILVFARQIEIRLLFSSRILVLSTIFLCYMFVTLLWGENYELSDFFKYGRRVLYILIFLTVTMYLNQAFPRFLRRLLTLLCFAALIAAIANILLVYSQHPFPGTRLLGYGRLFNPIQASSIYGIVFIACVYLIQQQENKKSQFLYATILAFSFGYMLLAQSRGPLAALAFTIFVWILSVWMHPKAHGRHRIQIFGAGLLIVTTGLIIVAVYPEFFQSFITRGGGGTGYRLEIWGKFLTEAANALWFGHGLNADTRIIMADGTAIPNPHGFYISTLFFGGIIGLSLLLILVASALWHGLIRAGKPINFVLGLMLLFGSICVVADGYTLIQHPNPFWLFFLFPLAAIAASELPENPLRSQDDGK